MRYLILILLNLPIILLAFLNIVTQYKMKKMPKDRFYRQLIAWTVILVVVAGSFPIYNIFIGKAVFDSINLSSFDIVQTTAIIFLFYVINNQRRKIDQSERRMRDLHQELSILLSTKNHNVDNSP